MLSVFLLLLVLYHLQVFSHIPIYQIPFLHLKQAILMQTGKCAKITGGGNISLKQLKINHFKSI